MIVGILGPATNGSSGRSRFAVAPPNLTVRRPVSVLSEGYLMELTAIIEAEADGLQCRLLSAARLQTAEFQENESLCYLLYQQYEGG